MAEDTIKNYIDNIEYHISLAASIADKMQQDVFAAEGDSDLYRKLQVYLSPNLKHWISGAQAGNVKDLRDLLSRREKDQSKK